MNSSSQTVIEPKQGWQGANVKELWVYRDLLYFLTWRIIKVRYKQTILGVAWAVLGPFFTLVVFSVVFGGLAEIPSDGVPYPIFSYAALIPWGYFSTSLSGSTGSLIGSAKLLTKVYFPRIIIPIVPVLAGFFDFVISFILMILLMLWFNIWPTWNVIFLPLLILMLMLTATGVGLWMSALAIQYRDVKNIASFLTRLLLFVTPVVWPLSLIPEQYQYIYALYPMVGVIEGFRSALLNTTPMPWHLIAIGSVSAITIFISGMFFFNRQEYSFADVV